MTAHHGAIGHGPQQRNQRFVGGSLLLGELSESLIAFHLAADDHREWFERLYASQIRARNEEGRGYRGEPSTELYGLSMSGLGERSVTIVSVEVGTRAGLGVTNQIQRHSRNLQGEGERTAKLANCGVGYFDRNRADVERRGFDPGRLPPGQYLTERFPVLHVGDVPTYAPGEWTLVVSGAVAAPLTLSYEDLLSLPSTDITTDIHCVTKWSKFDTVWRGVRVKELFERAKVDPRATHVMAHAEYGYTANLPLADATRDDCLVAYAYDGTEIEPIHGGPVRLVIPHLYFWKSAKWLRGLELRTEDAPGFWEQNGYHMYGDPFREQRFWGD